MFASKKNVGRGFGVALLTLVANGASASFWFQGFESDTSGWFDETSGWAGTVTRVSSGSGSLGVASSSGGWHAEFTQSATEAAGGTTGPFSRFDGYRDTWPGSYRAAIDIYLDPQWVEGSGFDYSVASSGSDGNHQRDFIFHVTKDTSTGDLLVGGSNNSNFEPKENLESDPNHVRIIDAGWYTFEHYFYDSVGTLAVDLILSDAGGSEVFRETRNNPSDLIPSEVGGNRYAWFTNIDIDGAIAVDNHRLESVPLPATLLLFCVGVFALGARTGHVKSA
ncbi:MAG: PEP-CTERM sorting domain-containing protein [Pseudohaliea sp.]